MIGTVIDFNHFETFVVLEDDTVLRIPMSKVNSRIKIGSVLNLSSSILNSYSHQKTYLELYQSNLLD